VEYQRTLFKNCWQIQWMVCFSVCFC
jgi:hypothetical protein